MKLANDSPPINAETRRTALLHSTKFFCRLPGEKFQVVVFHPHPWGNLNEIQLSFKGCSGLDSQTEASRFWPACKVLCLPPHPAYGLLLSMGQPRRALRKRDLKQEVRRWTEATRG